jgi:hypothetical protein
MASLRDYLLLLRTDDVEKFRQYLQSPFFAIEGRDRLFELFEYIWQNARPDFEETKLANAYLSQQLKFVVNNHKTTLIRSLEEYFKLTNMLGEYQNAKYFLVYELAKRDYYNDSKKKMTDVIKHEEAKDVYSVEHYRSLAELYNCYNRHVSFENFVPDAIATSKSSHYLGVYYLCRHLSIIIPQISRLHTVKGSLDAANIEALLQYIQKSSFCNNLLIDLYVRAIEVLLSKELHRAFFNDFKNTVIENFNKFGELEKKTLDFLLNTFGYMLFIKHGLDFSKDLFEWYVFVHEAKFLKTPHDVTDGWLINVVQVSLKLRKYDFAMTVIHSYTPLLSNDMQENVKNLLLAILHCEKGNYAQCLEHLLVVKPENLTYFCMVKYLRIRCYYELDEMDVGEYDLDNLRRQMDRIGGASEEYKQRFSLFIKAARKLEEAPQNTRVFAELQTLINKNPQMAYRAWIMEKFDSIKKH